MPTVKTTAIHVLIGYSQLKFSANRPVGYSIMRSIDCNGTRPMNEGKTLFVEMEQPSHDRAAPAVSPLVFRRQALAVGNGQALAR